MPVHNSEIADAFEQIADLLEIKGANPFRTRAYRNASRTVSSLSSQIHTLLAEGEDLTELSDIGADLAGRIEEFVKTGEMTLLEELKEEIPAGLLDLFKVEGLGPKKIKKLYEELDITTLAELKKAAESGKITRLEGFGEKTTEKILTNLEKVENREERFLLSAVEQQAYPLIDVLEEVTGVDQVEIAGSFRRRRDSVGDLDLLVTADDSGPVMKEFTNYEDVVEVLAEGETKASVVLRSGLQVDLRVVKKESWGAALLYFTGSKEHNVALRGMAGDRDLKINEYGVFSGEDCLGGYTEKEIYRILDCDYIEPELRENRGELQAAREGGLPELVSKEDMKGDLQSHTPGSDGKNSLEEMAEAARARGYEYLAITDHSDYLAVAGGLDSDGLKKQGEKIDELNQNWDDFKLLKSVEVDILPAGKLALDDEVLQELDIVSAAIHSKFDLSEKKQTRRITEALKNPYINVFVHPTGRKIVSREPYAIDLEKIMEVAVEENSFLEINASPERLDLNDVQARRAREMGLKLTISTDAHSCPGLDNMRYGVGQARRGWLRKQDVLNTRSWKEIKNILYLN